MTLSAADFELLLQANRILSSKLDSVDVLQAVMELATKVVRAEASSLLLLDAAANELYFDVALGTVKDSVKRIRLKVGEGVAGWVAKERQPLIVNDVSKDKRFTSKVDKSTSFKTKSILAVPLIAKGRLIGVVEAINKEHGGKFSDQDREAFEVFGSQAAVAIENAQLFSDVMREKEKLNTVFTEMSDGVLFLDASGKVTLMNAASVRLLGVAFDKAAGKDFEADLLQGFEATPKIGAALASKEKMTPVELVRRAGKDLMLSALFLRLDPDSKGRTQGSLVILRDVTEQRRGEMLKRNFLSLISHKLKTPLTVILGYAPVLQMKMDNLTEPQKKAANAICEQGENLGGLVDKLLRFAIIESDTIEKKIEAKEVAALLKLAIDGVDGTDGEAVRIEIHPSVASAPSVMVDGNLAVDVLKNVIENALKFNDKPKKEIVVSAAKKNGGVSISIKDNGIGIPPEEQGKVFQKFYQVENSFTGQVPGAGLGLALCKKVVTALGGNISLTSEIGKGTDVTISFPLKTTKMEAC